MVKVVDKKKIDTGVYWYGLQYDNDDELTGAKVTVTTASGGTALITCAPGSIAWNAGGSGKVQLNNAGTGWVPCEG